MALTQVLALGLPADVIEETKIADDGIDSEHYNDGSIDTAHIADNQVTLAKMAGLARGKLIVGDASGNPSALALGSANYVLTSDGNDAVWAASQVEESPTFTGNVAVGGTFTVTGLSTLSGLAYPTADGSSGQVLQTNGSGTLSFATVSGTTINNNADNRIITGSGTANTLEGEANFVFDGQNAGIGVSTVDNTSSASHTLQLASVTDNNWSGSLLLTSADASSIYSRIVASTDGLDLVNTKNTNMRFFTNNTEALRINSNQRVSIGTTISSEAKLDIRDAVTGTWITRMENTSAGDGMLLITAATLGSNATSNILDVRSGGTSYGTNQAFKVDATNTCYINTTSIWGSAGAHALAIQFSGNKGTGIGFKQYSSSATVYPMQFFNSGAGSAGSISYVYSSTSFNTSSDYRLKENILDMPSATNMVKALKPKTFEWKVDPDDTKQYGFLAHEVQDVFPNAVVGDKDAMHPAVLYEADDKEVIAGDKNEGDVKEAEKINPQQIDHSKLVPILVKTIQELEARITTLESS